jgi:hypothetical protein
MAVLCQILFQNIQNCAESDTRHSVYDGACVLEVGPNYFERILNYCPEIFGYTEAHTSNANTIYTRIPPKRGLTII